MYRAFVAIGVIIDLLMVGLLIIVSGWIIDSWHDRNPWAGPVVTTFWAGALILVGRRSHSGVSAAAARSAARTDRARGVGAAARARRFMRDRFRRVHAERVSGADAFVVAAGLH